MLKMTRLRTGAAIVALLLSAPLFADKLRLNVGYWPGQYKPELEDRFFMDDLVAGTGLGSLDLGWAGKNTDTIWPLGFSYFKPMGGGNLVLSANYTAYMPELGYNSIMTAGGFSAVTIASLKDYKSTDWDADLGYQIQVGSSQLFLTPKIGFRWHFTDYDYNALTLGSIVGTTVGDNKFNANARGTYAGLGFQFYLNKEISLIGEYATTSVFPDFGGSMTYKTMELFSGGGIRYTNQRSDYQVGINRWMLGLQYDVSANAHLMGGIRMEEQKHSYPGFFGMNFSGSGFSGIDISEVITDKIIWESEKVTKKGTAFFAVSYDINL